MNASSPIESIRSQWSCCMKETLLSPLGSCFVLKKTELMSWCFRLLSLWFPHIWHQQLHLQTHKTSTSSFNCAPFLIWFIRLSKIWTHTHILAAVCTTPGLTLVQEVWCFTRTFLTDCTERKKKIDVEKRSKKKKKSMSQGFKSVITSWRSDLLHQC